MHRAKTAILVTGGMDSTALLYMEAAKGKDIIAISVDYGHDVFKIQEELVNVHLKNLNLPQLVKIQIHFPRWMREPGLFTPGYVPQENRPLEDWDELRYKDFFIEGRNMIMVAYAMAYCSASKIDELLAGYLYHETEWKNRRTYKLMSGDNSPQFVDVMNLASTMGFSHQVRFRAPFYENRWSKKDVYDRGVSLGIDYSKTYSCYFDPPCGKCDNCLLRNEIGI